MPAKAAGRLNANRTSRFYGEGQKREAEPAAAVCQVKISIRLERMIKFALGRKPGKADKETLPDAESYYRRAHRLLEAEETLEGGLADMRQAAEMGWQQAL